MGITEGDSRGHPGISDQGQRVRRRQTRQTGGQRALKAMVRASSYEKWEVVGKKKRLCNDPSGWSEENWCWSGEVSRPNVVCRRLVDWAGEPGWGPWKWRAVCGGQIGVLLQGKQ